MRFRASALEGSCLAAHAARYFRAVTHAGATMVPPTLRLGTHASRLGACSKGGQLARETPTTHSPVVGQETEVPTMDRFVFYCLLQLVRGGIPLYQIPHHTPWQS